jgi:UDP:flavonoid glycosyltransferase YjiC (YdhE family)
MNIVILAIGSYGDVLPLVGLGRELRSRNHDVTLITNSHFANLVHLAGLPFVPFGTAEEYDAMADNPALWHPHKGWRLLMKRLVSGALEEAYTLLQSKIIPGRTLMISTTLGFAARLIQDTHRIPHVTVHLSPGVFHSAHKAPQVPGLSLPDWLPVAFKQSVWKFLDHTMIDPVVKANLNRFRRKLGLPPVSRIFHDWLHSPDLVLGFFPEWFAAPQPDWPPQTQVTGFPLFDDTSGSPLPPKVRDFLKQGSPPLIFTPGSAMKHGRRFFAEAARTCRLSGHRGIFLTRYPEQLPSSLPKGVKHYSYLPLSQLLPHAAALIHHGGIGTCSQALRACLPQVIQPLAFDQFDNAARIKQLGVGTVIPKRLFRAPLIAQHIQGLLKGPDVKTQCQNLKIHFLGRNSLEESCRLIETHFRID